MKRKSLVLLAAILIFSMLLTACSSNGQPAGDAGGGQGTIVIKGGSDGAPTMPANMAAQALNAAVEEYSDGRIKIDFYETRQLGNSEELLEQVMNGTIQFCLTGSSTMSIYTPLLEVLQLPFLLNSYEKEFAAARTPEFEAITKAIEEKFNIKILGVYEYGIRHLANNRNPINTLEDLQGLKVRVVPSNLILDTMNLLGTNPTPMAYGEVYAALQNNVIDGLEINWTSIYSEKFYEQLQYTSEISLFPFPAIYAVNLDFWNSLSAEDQEIFLRAADEAMDENLKIMQEIETKAQEHALANGVEVNRIEDLESFVNAVQPLYDKYTTMDPLMKAFVDKALELE